MALIPQGRVHSGWQVPALDDVPDLLLRESAFRDEGARCKQTAARARQRPWH